MARLTATVEADGFERLQVRIANDGDAPVRFSTATLLGPVAFEIVDASGERVPAGPPPMPPSDLESEALTLAPGESTTLSFSGRELFGDTPPAGPHRVRFAGHTPPLQDPDAYAGPISSAWVDVVS